MRVYVVIPAYNEVLVIRSVVQSVRRHGYDVVVVDDGSSDGTASAAQTAGAQVVVHTLNRGQGAALQTGIVCALRHGAEIIVTFDADGQHHAAEIDKVITPLLLGKVDVVLGSRFLKQNDIPIGRQALLRAATFFTRLYTGFKVSDAHNGFRAFSRPAAMTLGLNQDGMAHASEIIEQIKKHRLRYQEVGVTISYTHYSLRKGQKVGNAFNIVWDLLLGRMSK